jgi:alkaline phosphatase D
MEYLEFPKVSRANSRRSFLKQSTSLAGAVLLSACATGPFRRVGKFTGYPFSLGVASGDPWPDGFVIWTRLAPEPMVGGGMLPEPVEVSWMVAEDEGMGRVVRRGRSIARPEWGHSIHVEVEGLRADRWYWYQFKCGSEVSPVGRTRTAPSIGKELDKLQFAFVSCQHFEAGYFDAYRHLVKDNVELIIHLGDYIYENAGRDKQVRKHAGGEIISLEDYRNRYAQYRMDPALQLAHAAAPWLVTWDDHEVDNNYAGEVSEEINVSPRELLKRRAAAYQAFYEHMPIRQGNLPDGPDMQLYRKISYGNLVDFFVLDTRQYRTDQPCGDGRKFPCAQALSPKASLLGNAQREWLFNGLSRSTARWKVLAQQVMMARVDRSEGEGQEFSMDQWPGYEMERRRILQVLKDRKIQNPVVLTGDIHSNWANELCVHTDEEHREPVAAEFVGTSLSSGGDGREIPQFLDQTLAQNPFVKFHNAERGYVNCALSKRDWRSDYRVMKFVTKPNGPVTTRASFVVESGSSKILKA